MPSMADILRYDPRAYGGADYETPDSYGNPNQPNYPTPPVTTAEITKEMARDPGLISKGLGWLAGKVPHVRTFTEAEGRGPSTAGEWLESGLRHAIGMPAEAVGGAGRAMSDWSGWQARDPMHQFEAGTTLLPPFMPGIARPTNGLSVADYLRAKLPGQEGITGGNLVPFDVNSAEGLARNRWYGMKNAATGESLPNPYPHYDPNYSPTAAMTKDIARRLESDQPLNGEPSPYDQAVARQQSRGGLRAVDGGKQAVGTPANDLLAETSKGAGTRSFLANRPQDLPAIWRSVAPLPMDPASKLLRARELGFDTDKTWWHGTPNARFDQFSPMDPGTYFSSDPIEAGGYADVMGSKAADPYFVRGSIKEATVPYHRDIETHISALDAELEKAAAEGHSGVRYMDPQHGREVEMVVPTQNSNRIRRPEAAFDPANRNSPNLLAADQAKGAGVRAFSNYKTGEPMTADAYHGTDRGFPGGRYDPEFENKTWYGNERFGGMDVEDPEGGFWLTNNPKEAGAYAKSAMRHNAGDPGQTGANVIPAQVRFKNPYVVPAEDLANEGISSVRDYHDPFYKLAEQGYDGVVIPRDAEYKEKPEYKRTDEQLHAMSKPELEEWIRNRHYIDPGDLEHYVAIAPNTVFNRFTGERIFSNPGTQSRLAAFLRQPSPTSQ